MWTRCIYIHMSLLVVFDIPHFAKKKRSKVHYKFIFITSVNLLSMNLS